MESDRPYYREAESHSIGFRPLVCTGDRGDHFHFLRTIHDFGGFPLELYKVQYPAPGDPELAHRVQQLLAPLEVKLDNNWGLDHGTWTVLRYVYPDADIPVVQLSIDESRPASFHFEIGKRLATLRQEGVLIVGSGNVVQIFTQMRGDAIYRIPTNGSSTSKRR